jgi:hypothetical protein
VSIRSDYPVGESVARLAAWSKSGIADSRVGLEVSPAAVTIYRLADGKPVLRASWRETEGETRLEGQFLPPPSASRVLKLCSIVLALILALAAWAGFTQAHAGIQVSLLIFAVLSVLMFPYAIVAIASQALASQARLKRALERALTRTDA